MNIQRSIPSLVARRARFDADTSFALAPVLQANFQTAELRDGVIYETPADGALATLWNFQINNWLYRAVGDDLIVVADKSLRLGQDWVPSPEHDVLADESALDSARPEAILLVIEVSDATLENDLGDNAEAYAEHGVRDYWVVDPKARRLFAHRLGEVGGYGPPRLVGFQEEIEAALVPGLKLRLSDLPRL